MFATVKSISSRHASVQIDGEDIYRHLPFLNSADAFTITVGSRVVVLGEHPYCYCIAGLYGSDTPHLFYPLITIPYLYDTNGSIWNTSNNFAVGTYIFNLQDSNNNLPLDIYAIVLFVQGRWTDSSNSSICICRPRGSTAQAFQFRAVASAIAVSIQAIIPVDATNKDIEISIVNATMNAGICRAVGYFK